MTPDYNEMVETRVAPNALAVIEVINSNIVHNLGRDGASRATMLSTWRMAKLIVTERAPISLYSFPVTP